MKKAIVLAMTVLLALVCMTACSGGPEGTYKFSSMKMTQGGVEVEIKAGEQFMGAITFTEEFMQVTLNADGTASVKTAPEQGGSGEETGTWIKDEKDSSLILITFDGETQTFKLDGKTLTCTMDFQGTSALLTLKK